MAVGFLYQFLYIKGSCPVSPLLKKQLCVLLRNSFCQTEHQSRHYLMNICKDEQEIKMGLLCNENDHTNTQVIAWKWGRKSAKFSLKPLPRFWFAKCVQTISTTLHTWGAHFIVLHTCTLGNFGLTPEISAKIFIPSIPELM